jgi:hypothetical protein
VKYKILSTVNRGTHSKNIVYYVYSPVFAEVLQENLIYRDRFNNTDAGDKIISAGSAFYRNN